jgi:hypothetical protein
MRAGIVVLGFGFSLLSLGALADMAVEGGAAPAERVTLRLVWVDVQKIADPVRPVAFAETAALLESAGVDVAWERSDGSQREVQDGEVQVIVLPDPTPPLARHIMGAAQPGAHGVRVVWIYLGSIRNALGMSRRTQGMLRPTEAQRLGRAVARVVLHEVVHVQEPARPHGGAGLMAARLDRPFLESGRLEIEPELRPVFRAAADAGRTPAPASTLMAATGGATIAAAMAPMIAD